MNRSHPAPEAHRRHPPNLLLLLFLWLLLAAPTFADEDDDDVLQGMGAHFAWIVFDAIQADLEAATGRKIALYGKNSMLGIGCNAAIKLAKQASAQRETFGFVCCPLSEEEVAREGLIVYPLALEPILILVHDDNPVSNLSSAQVRAIFRGEITNWNTVGGADRPIVVITRLHCKQRPGHWKTLLPKAEDFREVRLNVHSAAAMIQRVNDFAGAIGHTGSTWVFKPEDRVKAVHIDGFAPTAANLAAGRYPFFRQLSAVTNRQPSPDVLKLIHEAQTGPAFRAVAKRYELLPLTPSPPAQPRGP